MSDADSVFVDVPDDLDESWRHGALLGGMVDLAARERGVLACSFKQAGDALIASALADHSANELLYPILFNYRHSLELYLKAVATPSHKNHDLKQLIEGFERVVREKFATDVPEWIVQRLREFEDVDSGSTAFRYPEAGVAFRSGRLEDEVWVDLPRLKRVMDRLETAFHRVLERLGTDS